MSMHILNKDPPSILRAKLNHTTILLMTSLPKVNITCDGYIIPLISREGLMYLEYIGKPTIDDLTKYSSVHLTSPHPWDPTMLDGPNPYHSLTTDGGEHGSPTENSEGSQPKIISRRVHNGFFRSRCDQDPSAVKPMFEFDPCHKSYNKFLSPPQENEEQSTEKSNKVLTTNFTAEIQNHKVEGPITYSSDLQIF